VAVRSSPSRLHSASPTPREVEVLQLTSEGSPQPGDRKYLIQGRDSRPACGSSYGMQGTTTRAQSLLGSASFLSCKLLVRRSTRNLMGEMVSLMATSGRLMRDDQMDSNR
jgi:hypothetical protein